MDRIKKLKRFLQENYPEIQTFNTRNITGDYMINVYNKDGIKVDYAPNYRYIEIFGLTGTEFDSLINKYGFLKKFKIEDE